MQGQIKSEENDFWHTYLDVIVSCLCLAGGIWLIPQKWRLVNIVILSVGWIVFASCGMIFVPWFCYKSHLATLSLGPYRAFRRYGLTGIAVFLSIGVLWFTLLFKSGLFEREAKEPQKDRAVTSPAR